jgi:hypothetical protein
MTEEELLNATPWVMTDEQLEEMLEQDAYDYPDEDEFAVPEDYDRPPQGRKVVVDITRRRKFERLD